MRFPTILALLSLAIVGLTSAIYAASLPDSSIEVKALVNGNSTFALDLYKELKKSNENLFFSPFSISEALGMTFAGARGNTESQMRNVLHFPKESQQVHSSFAFIGQKLAEIQQKDSIELYSANSLWPQKGMRLEKDFLDVCKTMYGVEIQPQDFKHSFEASRQKINSWVEDRTNKRILNLIPAGGLTEETRLVLVNAIYFKARWQSKFDSTSTRIDTFYVSSTKTTQTKLMNQVSWFRYFEKAELQLLELPYRGDEMVMTIILPRAVDGLSKIDEEISSDTLNSWFSHIRGERINVYLPKFKLTTSFELSSPLKKLGMVDPFAELADFSGISTTDTLKIDAVFHKAFVDIAEEKTEAAAATAVVTGMVTTAYEMPPPPPILFRADHPFIFLIRDKGTGSIFFMGRLSDPSKLIEN